MQLFTVYNFMNNSQIQQTAFQLVSAAKTGKPDDSDLVPHCTNPECPFFSHANLRTQLNLDENCVLDGFESFSRSQFFFNYTTILVGESSEIIYGMSFGQQKEDRSHDRWAEM